MNVVDSCDNQYLFTAALFLPRKLLFSTHIYNMEGKSSTETVRFFNVYLPIVWAE